MSLTNALFATIVIAAITFFTRVFPFLFFGKKQPPEIITFVGKYIPPIVITILVIYCLKDTNLTVSPYGFNELFAVVTVVLLHLWKNNPMISIFGATVLYMVLLQSDILSKII